jgi:hypothetical protein
MDERSFTLFDQSDCLLIPGEPVENSGIYEMCHTDEPRETVLLFRGGHFPVCSICGAGVRYKLVKAAPHVSEDPDFARDPAETDHPLLTAVPTCMLYGHAHGFEAAEDGVQAWRESPGSGDL